MSWRTARWEPRRPGPRHRAERYDQTGEPSVLEEGDHMLLPCEGGPSTSRLETFPPRLEIPERGGVYVLDDVGPRARWSYVFVPNGA